MKKSPKKIAKLLFGIYANKFNEIVIQDILKDFPDISFNKLSKIYAIYHINRFDKLKKI